VCRAGGAPDAAGNNNTASTSTDNTVTRDATAPSVTISQASGQNDPTNASPINFMVVFSESVTGFAAADVTLSGTAGATTKVVTGSGTTYNVAVSGMTSDGTVIATVPAGGAQDSANNSNTASTSTDNTVTRDTAAPTVTINQASGQNDPTNSSPINFTVVFSEPTTNFATGDVTVTGTAGGAKTATGTTYNVAVTGMTTSGTVIASIAAGLATDAAGNGNAASTSTDNTVTWDVTAPTVTINQASGQNDPTNASPINFTVVFSESVTGFTGADVNLSGTAGATTALVSGSGTTYNVAVSGMTSDGTVIATVPAGGASDAAGNSNTASTSTDNTVTYDTAGPSVTINQASGQADPSNAATINFTAVFSESVTGFTGADVTLSGTAGATTATVTGSGTTYNVAVTGMTSDGTVIASVPAGGASDAAGNLNNASTSTDNTVTRDATAPTATIDQASGQADPTNASPINFTVVFSESVTGFTGADVSFAGTAGGTKTATVTGSGTTYNVAVSGMTDGTLIASVPAGGAQDTANNNNTASTSTDNTVTYDATRPSVTINQKLGQADPSNSSPIEFTVVFSEPVTGFVGTDVSLSGTAGATTASVTGSGTTYNVAVSGMTSDGTVIATVPANGANDATGNLNFASSSTDNTVTYDTAGPSVTINQASGQADPSNAATINFTAVFSESVTGFTGSDVTLSGTAGATTATVTGSGTTYNVAVNGMTANGTVIATIPAGGAADNTVTRDATFPTVSSVIRNGTTPTNATSVSWTVEVSESVTRVDSADFSLSPTVTGASITSVTGSGDTYNVTVGTGTGSGTLQLNVVDNDTIQDPATNKLGGTGAGNGNFSGEAYAIDKVSATVTANSAAGQANPTNQTPINYTVTFSEPVAGFTATDVTLGGTAGATNKVVTGGPSIYNVEVSGMTSDGTVTVSVPAAAAQDPAGNPNSASNTASVSYDTTAPVVTLVTPANNSSTNDNTPAFSGVGGFAGGTASDSTTITIKIYSGTDTSGTLVQTLTDTRDGSGNYSVSSATLADGTYTARAEQNDTAGNTGYSSANTFAVDTVVPTVTVNQAAGQNDPTNQQPVNFTATFSEPVSGFVAADVTIGGSAPGTQVATVTGGPAIYNIAISGSTGSGTVTATVGAGKANDAAGNQNTASTSTDNSVTLDLTSPTVTSINRVGSSPTNASTVSWTVTFSESVSGVNASDFSLVDVTNSISGEGIISVTPGGPSSTDTVTVTTGAGDGTLRLDLTDDDSITDGVGNKLGGAGTGNGNFTGQTIVIDKTVPTVVSITRNDANPNASTSVSWTVTFSENVTGVTADDFVEVTSGTVTNGADSVSSASATPTDTVTVSTVAGDGTLGLNLVDNDSIVDAAGNPLGGSGTTGAGDGSFVGEVYTIDNTAPTVTDVNSTTADGTYEVGATISIQVTFSENVNVTGTPTLTLNFGGTASYTSGTGTNVLTFTYTVATGDSTSDLNATSLNLGGGIKIRDAATNNATLTLPAAPNSLSAHKDIVIDGVAPTVTSVSSTAINGEYIYGDTLAITVNFSEPVLVTGTPKLQLALDSGVNPFATYASGSGTSTLTFSYTVGDKETTDDLNYVSTSSLQLNGGTIKDAVNNNAVLTLPATGNAIRRPEEHHPGERVLRHRQPVVRARELDQAFTVTLTNSVHSYEDAQRVKIAIPAGWTVNSGSIVATTQNNTTCPGSANGTWTNDGTIVSGRDDLLADRDDAGVPGELALLRDPDAAHGHARQHRAVGDDRPSLRPG